MKKPAPLSTTKALKQKRKQEIAGNWMYKKKSSFCVLFVHPENVENRNNMQSKSCSSLKVEQGSDMAIHMHFTYCTLSLMLYTIKKCFHLFKKTVAASLSQSFKTSLNTLYEKAHVNILWCLLLFSRNFHSQASALNSIYKINFILWKLVLNRIPDILLFRAFSFKKENVSEMSLSLLLIFPLEWKWKGWEDSSTELSVFSRWNTYWKCCCSPIKIFYFLVSLFLKDKAQIEIRF